MYVLIDQASQARGYSAQKLALATPQLEQEIQHPMKTAPLLDRAQLLPVLVAAVG